MKTASFRIWTRVTESYDYDNNHYTMSVSIQLTYIASNNSILFVLIYFLFNLVGPYNVILRCHQTRFNLSLKIFLSKQCPSLFMWYFVCCMKYPYSCVSFYFCFLNDVVLLIIVLFVILVTVIIYFCLCHVVFKSSYRWIDAMFNAGEYSPSLFSCYR